MKKPLRIELGNNDIYALTQNNIIKELTLVIQKTTSNPKVKARKQERCYTNSAENWNEKVRYSRVGEWVSGLLVVTRGLTEEREFVVFCLHV